MPLRKCSLAFSLSALGKDIGSSERTFAGIDSFVADIGLSLASSTSPSTKSVGGLAFSGGVDSAVCASLVNQAVGDQLIAVHVDTGYMRKNESESVKKLMKKILTITILL